jgi:hypothetical protein
MSERAFPETYHRIYQLKGEGYSAEMIWTAVLKGLTLSDRVARMELHRTYLEYMTEIFGAEVTKTLTL